MREAALRGGGGEERVLRERALGIGLARLPDFGKDFPGEGIVYRSGCVPLAPLAADEKWTWSLQEDTPLLEEGYDGDSTEDAGAGSAFAACSEALALATKSSVPQSAMASIANASYVETP